MAVTSLNKSRPNYVANATWVRPADWLTLPTLVASDQKVVALAHLHSNDRNWVTFTIQGAYTVDWGDGSAPVNYASGVKAEKNLTFASAPANTLTSDGYRQVIITVTMQSGQAMTNCTFSATPTGVVGGLISALRDVSIAGAGIATSQFSHENFKNGARWVTWVGPSSMTSMSDWSRSGLLRGVTGTEFTRNSVSFFQMFTSNAWLQTVPLFETSQGTNFQGMFGSCAQLRSVPLFDTSKSTSFTAMFNGCASLVSVPLFDMSRNTSLNSTFSGCILLTSLPLFNTSLVTDFSSMCLNCNMLRTVPALDLSSGITFSSMFANCISIQTIPLFNTSKGVNFGAMFQNCTSLQSIPALDTSLGTNFTSMFQSTSSIESVSLNTSKAVTINNMFFSSSAVKTVVLDMSGITSAAAANQLFSSTVALTSVVLTGLRFSPSSTSLTNLSLTTAGLNALWNSLGTASGAQTLTVTGNPGSGSSNTAIATAKGWTIVGG